jgi:hypothetical protein
MKWSAGPEVLAKAAGLAQQSPVVAALRFLAQRDRFLLAAGVFFLALAFPLLFEPTLILRFSRAFFRRIFFLLISVWTLAYYAASFLKCFYCDFQLLPLLRRWEIFLVSEMV